MIEENADVYCFQESKANENTIDPSLLDVVGYRFYPYYSQNCLGAQWDPYSRHGPFDWHLLIIKLFLGT